MGGGHIGRGLPAFEIASVHHLKVLPYNPHSNEYAALCPMMYDREKGRKGKKKGGKERKRRKGKKKYKNI